MNQLILLIATLLILSNSAIILVPINFIGGLPPSQDETEQITNTNTSILLANTTLNPTT